MINVPAVPHFSSIPHLIPLLQSAFSTTVLKEQLLLMFSSESSSLGTILLTAHLLDWNIYGGPSWKLLATFTFLVL